MQESFIQLFKTPSFLWFAAGLITLFIEFLAPNFILFFFGVSGIVVGLLCLFIALSINAQLSLFIILSIASILILRKRFKTYFYGEAAPDTQEEDAFEGKLVSVLTAIASEKPGKVEFQGTTWTAYSQDTLNPGEMARIIKKENISLFVESTNKTK